MTSTALSLAFSTEAAGRSTAFAPRTLWARLHSTRNVNLLYMLLAVAALYLLAFQVGAANNTGLALKPAFDILDGIVNGYGKQLLFVLGFAVAGITYMVANTTSVIMKFVGYAIFLGVALAGGLTLVGAVI